MLYPLIIVGSLALVLFIFWRAEKRGRTFNFSRLLWLRRKKDDSGDRGLLGQDPTLDLFQPPDRAAEYFSRAESLFSEKKYLSAEKWFLESARLDPQNPRVYARLGTIYFALKNYKDAKEALQNAARLDPEVSARHFNLALVLFRLGENRQALNSINRAIELKGDDPKYPALKEGIEEALSLTRESTVKKRSKPKKKS